MPKKEKSTKNDKVEPEQKKRGRKPKSKNDAPEEKPLPKKRGRRPKDKTYSSIINIKDINLEEEDEEVILHLPMNQEIETNESNNVPPKPYDPDDKCNYAMLSNDIQEKINELDEEDDEETLKVRSSVLEETSPDYFNLIKKVKVHRLMGDYEGSNYPDNTNIACFNCTYEFDTMPIGIPIRYVNGKFHCVDNFCSFNCAARYIFKGDSNLNEVKKWESYSLLNLMYSKLFEIDKVCKIKLAPKPTLLKRYGGNLSVEDYRKDFSNPDKMMKVSYPPCISVLPVSEETSLMKMNRKKTQFIGNDKSSYIGSGLSDLRLKRDKTIENKNTLENYMSLKIQ